MVVSTCGTWIRNFMMQKIINPVYVYSLPLAGVPLPLPIQLLSQAYNKRVPGT